MGNLLKVRQSSFFVIRGARPCLGLLKKLDLCAGRGNHGNMTLLHRGGGLKRRYRIVDFRRVLWNLGAMVLYKEYDPNRTSFLSLICYFNGVLSYVLSTEGIFSGDYIYSGTKVFFGRHGNALPLVNIPEGSLLNCLEISPGLGAKLIRAAGVSAVLLKKFTSGSLVLVRLSSKEEVLVDYRCFSTLGQVSRSFYKLEGHYKAGQLRRKNFRPVTRGVARNPVDHPHGGGGGRCQVTYWAKVAKNRSTRKSISLGKVLLITRSRKVS